MPLQLDPSARVPIERIRVGKSFGFTMTFEEAVTGTWTIAFYPIDGEGNTPLLDLIQNTDFTISGSVITVYVDKTRNTLIRDCYWRANQSSGNAKVLVFEGTVKVSA